MRLESEMISTLKTCGDGPHPAPECVSRGNGDRTSKRDVHSPDALSIPGNSRDRGAA